jgi:hypothetical protein
MNCSNQRSGELEWSYTVRAWARDVIPLEYSSTFQHMAQHQTKPVECKMYCHISGVVKLALVLKLWWKLFRNMN